MTKVPVVVAALLVAVISKEPLATGLKLPLLVAKVLVSTNHWPWALLRTW